MKPLQSLLAHLRPKASKTLPEVIALPDRSCERVEHSETTSERTARWIEQRDARIQAARAREARDQNGGSNEGADPIPAPTSAPIRTASEEPTTARRPYQGRLAVLLAAIAVPAMAAPGDFGAMAGAAPTEAEMVSAELAAQLEANPAMPFERPGMSFPGSAFYFLADPPSDGELVALPTTDALDIGAAEADRELGEVIDTGPSANPFFSGSGLNHDRALKCLAQAVWYEAASESEAGQRAVAQVVLNRVSHPSWPGSVCGVVYQGSQRSTGCQFSFTCDGSLARRAGGSTWARAERIAGDALSGDVYQPVGYATHYHTLWVNPYWAPSLDHVGTIGAHRFYRNRGAAGRKEAFTGRYAGFEPGVSGRTVAAPAAQYSDASLPDLPSVNGEASDATASSQYTPTPQPTARTGTRSAARTNARAAPLVEPVLADEALSVAGQTREEYSRAGQWKDSAAREALEAERSATAQERPAPRP